MATTLFAGVPRVARPSRAGPPALAYRDDEIPHCVRNDELSERGFDVEVRSPYRARVDPPREIDAGEAVEE